MNILTRFRGRKVVYTCVPRSIHKHSNRSKGSPGTSYPVPEVNPIRKRKGGVTYTGSPSSSPIATWRGGKRRDASTQDVALLVVCDLFGATTHTDILLRARALGIPTRVIHNASIMNAVGACGLQLYNFGQTVSLVFFTDTWRPDGFYDRVRSNADLRMHTLVLLDIKVKEQGEENLARGHKIYEPSRYMYISQAVAQLADVDDVRQEAATGCFWRATSQSGDRRPATIPPRGRVCRGVCCRRDFVERGCTESIWLQF